MPFEEIVLEAEEKMEKVLGVLQGELRGVRTGRASIGLVDGLRVDYYGAPTPLKSLASITVPEPRMILVKPFDPSSTEAVVKAIQKSEVGLTPQTDGKIVRLAVPPLSEERRRQFSKMVKEWGEKAKVSLRNVRREAKGQADSEEKAGKLPEDDAEKTRGEIDKLIKQFEGKVEGEVEKKTKEVMEI